MARYRMRERLLSIGEDYTIEDDRGNEAFYVDGKVLRLRETFALLDREGKEVATIREKLISIRDTMHVLRGGDVVATIKKALFTPFRDKFTIELAGGGELTAHGDFFDHEYEIERDGDAVAHVSKKWFTIRDTYGIEVADGEDDPLILAIAVAIDEMVHEKKDD
jgi:uncharacterized protein YxjI